MLTISTYRKVLSAAAVLIFFTNLALYLFETRKLSVPPLYWIAATGLLAAPIAFHALTRSGMRIGPIAIWCHLYLMVTLLWFLLFPAQPAGWPEVRSRVLAVIFLLVVLVLFSDEGAQRIARRTIVVGVLLGVGTNLYDLVHPLTFSEIMGRSAGLYVNSNQSGAALVLGMILTQGVVPRRFRLVYQLFIGLGVLVTFSRGGAVGWLMVFLLANARSRSKSLNLRGVCVVSLLVAAFLMSPWWGNIEQSLYDHGVLNANVRERLAFFSQGTTGDDSAASREEVAHVAWDIFAAHPLVGLGTGAAKDTPPLDTIGPHNMYLMLMIDHGVIGALLLPLLVLASTWRASGAAKEVAIPFACFILFWGLVSHNVLDERYILLSFALTGAMTVTSREPVRAGSSTAPVRLRPALSAGPHNRRRLREAVS